MKSSKDLIETWKIYKPKSPYVLPGDELLFGEKWTDKVWKDQIRTDDFLDPKSDNSFQLGYLPVPFAGNLKKASIFILMLNPGFSPADAYGEGHNQKFKKVLRDCLRQTSAAYFYPLDPKFSWTGAFNYWHKKLEKLISEIATKSKRTKSFSEARRFLASHLVCIEMIPYHSVSFKNSRKLIDLPSAQLARNFVKEHLFKRALKGEVLIVVTRKINVLGLEVVENKVINYTSGEARGAHLTPKSPGGSAIINFLKNKNFERNSS
jgi:hypothetical protein